MKYVQYEPGGQPKAHSQNLLGSQKSFINKAIDMF